MFSWKDLNKDYQRYHFQTKDLGRHTKHKLTILQLQKMEKPR
jgi:hypothetical protein